MLPASQQAIRRATVLPAVGWWLPDPTCPPVLLPPRSGNAFHETRPKRIASSSHDNRYRAGSIQRCFGGAVGVGHDHIDRKPHQLCSKFRKGIQVSPSKAEFENDGLALDVTQVAQPFT